MFVKRGGFDQLVAAKVADQDQLGRTGKIAHAKVDGLVLLGVSLGQEGGCGE